MILKDNLYTITAAEPTSQGASFHLELNPQHFIYQAHFPNHPITPGVCIVQIAKELLETHIKKNLNIKNVKNVKFLSVITPNKDREISCDLKIQAEETDGTVKAQAVLYGLSETFAKISFLCTPL